MRLHTSATQIDFYPVGTGKRFIKRVIWHPEAENDQRMISFTTRVKSDAMYDINQYIANGATVSDFNLNAYEGHAILPSTADHDQNSTPQHHQRLCKG